MNRSGQHPVDHDVPTLPSESEAETDRPNTDDGSEHRGGDEALPGAADRCTGPRTPRRVRPASVAVSTVTKVPITARLVSMIALVAAVATGCQRPEPESAPSATPAPVDEAAPTTATSTPAPTTSVATTTAPTTTSPPATTAPPAPPSTAPPVDSAPPTTTPAPPSSPADLVLDFDGVLPFSFGRPDGEVVDGLVGVLGAPVSDESLEYPVDDEGTFIDDTGDLAFVAPFGRTVCFADGLCTEFGTGSDTALQFTGWRYIGEPSELTTAEGVTIGSTWAEHPDVITVDTGGCVTIGSGMVDGVQLTLRSNGIPFAIVADDGSVTAGAPDPADVEVVGLQAGELPIARFEDC